jgi:hypothetical protein
MIPKRSFRLGAGDMGAKSDTDIFSRLLAVETVPDTGLDIKLCASEVECALLAAQCGVVAVQTFEADLNVRKQGLTRFKVSGALQALVTQTCVVTLEPFDSLVRADIDVDFAPDSEPLDKGNRRKMAGAGPAAASLSDEDPPDSIVNGQIDLGALAAEFLVLNLDIYPRKPGAVFEETHASGEAPERDSPFAVLRRPS